MEETVRLYTRQNDKTLRALERDGRILNHRAYVEMHFGSIAPLFLESYDWFTKEAQKIVPKPEYAQASIWCSISAQNCLKPIDGTVVYVLDVPKNQIVYFDEVKWDYVLNRIYLPKDAKDDEKYKQELKERGFKSRFEFFEGRYKGLYPEEEKRIIDSWKRVFEIEEWSIFRVCGNIWEIKKEWVHKIVHPNEPIEDASDRV
ncbi:DUF3841 domain-containing protein [Suipraeoptans intestinalis]|uniref:DUF3841 domain-containing protein n=1 Tax=Suipraeoptans intestinalis TaxID=2606628 RepID=UPI002A7668A2|nr:DUF3841 domain-containing protein [Suipraeoptans intestinalis]MDY3122041.1 DUF3841 domain-containing protein [Suipraeoptans intestinalis]